MEDVDARIKDTAFTSFREALSQADGTLIALPGKKTKLGEKLFISARYGPIDSLGEADHLLLIDVFAEEDSRLKPVGHYDWELRGDHAIGNKNRHGGHLASTTACFQEADKCWTEEGFKVDGIVLVSYAMAKGGFPYMDKLRADSVVKSEDDWQEPLYQKSGIGRLMIASSLIALNAKGINVADFGHLSSSAISAWRPFNSGQNSPVDVPETVKSKAVFESVARFI